MKNKIILLCVLMIIASTMFTGMIIYRKAALVIEENVNKHMSEILQQSTNYLDEKLRSMLIQVHFLQTTEAFKTAMQNTYTQNKINYAVEFSKVEPLLTQIKSRDDYIHSIFIHTPQGNFYNYDVVWKKEYIPYAYDLYKNVQERGLIYWGTTLDSVNLEDKVIPVAMKIALNPNIVPEDRDLYIVINLRQESFEAYFKEIAKKIKGDIFIINEDNQLVIGSYGSQYNDILYQTEFLQSMNNIAGQGSFNYNDPEKLLINVSSLDINGWKMISVQREVNILEDIRVVKTLTILSALFFILLTAVLSVYFANNITKSITRLQKMMEKAPNNQFNLRFQPKYNDEVGQLGKSFDSMSDKIQMLLEELKLEQEHIKKEQKLKRRAELQALQAQINPHFLYNALDSIYWRSMMQGNEIVSEMAVSLSNVFRIGLNKGKEFTTVYKEVQHVENYLSIQKIVYEDKFDYTIYVEEEVYAYKTLKLVLQPLVENSIVHGFQNIESGGKIALKVRIDKNKICFEVKDNGSGFSREEMLATIKDTEEEYTGYALRNVYQRLKLHYGEDCMFDLYSEPFMETTVCIYIPMEKEEEKDRRN